MKDIRAGSAALWMLFIFGLSAPTYGQAGGSPGNQETAGANLTLKSTAPIETDLTGNWVSIINADWRWRMLPPPKGDYASIPINAEGKRVADTWDPAKDQAAGEQCRSYGAPAIMRVPERLHITWQDDNTLKVETDAGQQVRLLHFIGWQAPHGAPAWQGDSVAKWEPGGTIKNKAGGEISRPKYGALQVTTTHIRPGYLRKNGVPYSANTELVEYWNLNREPNGAQWLVITAVVHDPTYLQEDWITALDFRKEPDSSKWDPQPCSARW
jgi:hypothetical protein